MMITKGFGILCLVFAAITTVSAAVAKPEAFREGLDFEDRDVIAVAALDPSTTTSIPTSSLFDHVVHLLPRFPASNLSPTDIAPNDGAAPISPITPTGTGVRATTTSASALPGHTDCSWGPPIDNGTVPGGWPIHYELISLYNRTSFKVRDSWYKGHFISGPHYFEITHSDDTPSTGPGDNYGAYKCQLLCDNSNTCASFFGSFVNVDTHNERYECVLFNEIIDPEVLVITNGSYACGGYDSLCYQVPNPWGKTPSATPVRISATL